MALILTVNGVPGIATEALGGDGPLDWEVRVPEGGYIKEIKAKGSAVIDGLTFTVDDGTGKTTVTSAGGSGGSEFPPLEFDKDEHITGVKGVHGVYLGTRALGTLYIRTNKRGWLPPFGYDDKKQRTNDVAYYFGYDSGVVAGFHGTGGSGPGQYVNSIGCFVKPQPGTEFAISGTGQFN